MSVAMSEFPSRRRRIARRVELIGRAPLRARGRLVAGPGAACNRVEPPSSNTTISSRFGAIIGEPSRVRESLRILDDKPGFPPCAPPLLSCSGGVTGRESPCYLLLRRINDVAQDSGMKRYFGRGRRSGVGDSPCYQAITGRTGRNSPFSNLRGGAGGRGIVKISLRRFAVAAGAVQDALRREASGVNRRIWAAFECLGSFSAMP
jgi:hypothetical protein